MDAAPSEELNLTPYLDVLMNLIVFVLVSGAGLVTWGVLPAQTASPGSGVSGGPVPQVRLAPDGMTLSLSGEAPAQVTLDELPARLAAAQGHELVLAAEPEVTLEQLVSTMDAARKAHFDEVTLAD